MEHVASICLGLLQYLQICLTGVELRCSNSRCIAGILNELNSQDPFFEATIASDSCFPVSVRCVVAESEHRSSGRNRRRVEYRT